MQDDKAKFIRLTKDRSDSNISAILTLFNQKLYGQATAILRQELDSLIRVCYLLALPDSAERQRLINSTINGVKWKIGKSNVTDRDMVKVASRYNHWAPEVYDFGNRFTHLTDFHDYKTIDPLATLEVSQKQMIRHYLSSYHQFPGEMQITFENVISYLPKVARKVSNNLNSYLSDLESDRYL
jgi:hypothetical protein